MANQEINRDEIIAVDDKDYGFDKILRGYDPKQVNEYINNLVITNKKASMMFDDRLADARNDAEMLRFELEQTKASLTEIKSLFSDVSAQRDELKAELQKSSTGVTVDSNELDEMKEKLDQTLKQNRTLRDSNKKFEEENTNLKRDVAHLTKKVDKNRFEIKNLREQIETEDTDGANELNAELAQIYESAMEKAEDMIYRLQTEFSLSRSKAEDIKSAK